MPSLQQYRIATARGLGGYEDRGDVAATGARRVTTDGTPASLIEARWPIQRGRIDSDFYQGAMLYRTGVGATEGFQPFDRVRQIPTDGYDAEDGKFIPDTDWMLPPTLGEEYELHLHGFDPEQQLTALINQTLRAITLIVDTHFTLEHDARGWYVPALDAAGNALATWLTAPEQLVALRAQPAPGPLAAVNWNETEGHAGYRGSAWSSGDRLYLLAAGGLSTSSVYAQCYKPAYYHCRATGAGDFGSLSGLTPGSETNEAVPDAEWVAAGAVALAWESFDDMEAAAQRIRGLRHQAAKAAFYRRQNDYYTHHLGARTFVPYAAVV